MRYVSRSSSIIALGCLLTILGTARFALAENEDCQLAVERYQDSEGEWHYRMATEDWALTHEGISVDYVGCTVETCVEGGPDDCKWKYESLNNVYYCDCGSAGSPRCSTGLSPTSEPLGPGPDHWHTYYYGDVVCISQGCPLPCFIDTSTLSPWGGNPEGAHTWWRVFCTCPGF